MNQSSASALKTIDVLVDRRNQIDELVAAGEVLDLQFERGKQGLSLRAAKLFHVLVEIAGSCRRLQ